MATTDPYSHLPTWVSVASIVVGIVIALSVKRIVALNLRWIEGTNRLLARILGLQNEEALNSLQETPFLQKWTRGSYWVWTLVVSLVFIGMGLYALWQGPPPVTR